MTPRIGYFYKAIDCDELVCVLELNETHVLVKGVNCKLYTPKTLEHFTTWYTEYNP